MEEYNPFAEEVELPEQESLSARAGAVLLKKVFAAFAKFADTVELEVGVGVLTITAHDPARSMVARARLSSAVYESESAESGRAMNVSLAHLQQVFKKARPVQAVRISSTSERRLRVEFGEEGERFYSKTDLCTYQSHIEDHNRLFEACATQEHKAKAVLYVEDFVYAVDDLCYFNDAVCELSASDELAITFRAVGYSGEAAIEFPADEVEEDVSINVSPTLMKRIIPALKIGVLARVAFSDNRPISFTIDLQSIDYIQIYVAPSALADD